MKTTEITKDKGVPEMQSIESHTTKNLFDVCNPKNQSPRLKQDNMEGSLLSCIQEYLVKITSRVYWGNMSTQMKQNNGESVLIQESVSTLSDSARAKCQESVKRLIQSGIDPRSGNPSALELAIDQGDAAILNLCLTWADEKNRGIVYLLAKEGNLDLLKSIFVFEIAPEVIDRQTLNGFTALHAASQGGHQEIVKFLLDKGASSTAKSNSGKMPIDMAKKDASEIRRILTDHQSQSQRKITNNSITIGHGFDQVTFKPRESFPMVVETEPFYVRASYSDGVKALQLMCDQSKYEVVMLYSSFI